MEQNPERKQEYYLMEAADGSLVRVPEDRLESWETAQQQPDRPLSRAQQLLAESLRRRIYG